MCLYGSELINPLLPLKALIAAEHPKHESCSAASQASSGLSLQPCVWKYHTSRNAGNPEDLASNTRTVLLWPLSFDQTFLPNSLLKSKTHCVFCKAKQCRMGHTKRCKFLDIENIFTCKSHARFLGSRILTLHPLLMQHSTASAGFIPLFCFLIAQFHHLSVLYLKK